MYVCDGCKTFLRKLYAFCPLNMCVASNKNVNNIKDNFFKNKSASIF